MNKKHNKISVIIPIYNAERYIKKCIKSFQRQTFKEFKLILIDDGSQDRSGKICDDMARKDDRIHVIHQPNKGSVEARKRGVLSDEAQHSEYIALSDADDIVEVDALEKLYNAAKKYNAECVCANMRKYWKGIKITDRYQRPCFDIESPQVYEQKEIIEKLYISCFGISNYPVNLVAKLYKTELITEAINFPPIVQFMGEDLSVTLRCLPKTQKLVIIPDIIYNYRIGGGTSRFMPYMLEDFLSLYRNKKGLAKKYPMPQDAMFFMDIELMNVVFSWLVMCKNKGKYAEEKMRQEIERVNHISEIKEAANELYKRKEKNHIAVMIKEHKYDDIYKKITDIVARDRKKNIIKSLVNKL